MISIAWLILWIPFFAALTISLFCLGRPKAAGWIATGSLLVDFVLALVLLSGVGITPGPPLESSIPWITLSGITVEFGVLVNGLTLLMLLVVTGVGSLIFLYSQEYMEHDKGTPRYFICLSFFAFSMLGIVLANNFIQIFIFWELVGLSSYLLIGHWFEKPEASEAGKKAFLTTRVGDVGFLIGILLLFGWLQAGGEGTFNFLKVESLLVGIGENVGAGSPRPWASVFGGEVTSPLQILTAAGLLIFLGVMGKSAQFPLHVWLPDAMEGPTPVSALIHAATMVAAGVFLLARLFFLFSVSPVALSFIAGIGTLTAFLAATMAIVQTDIKRILAYSTLSQLGYMVTSLGLADPRAGMFHLTTHAFFKALLFLGAGVIIHELHTQDIRKVSGLLGKMPVTGWTFLVGTLALVGIFPFSGFWSKEEILVSAYSQNPVLFIFLLLTMLLTAIYMGRLFATVFLGNAPKEGRAKDPSWIMKAPLLILALFSLAGGWLPWKKFLPMHVELAVPPWVTLLGLTAATGGLLLTLYLYVFQPMRVKQIYRLGGHLRRTLEEKYYIDEIYDLLIRHVQDRLARLCDLFERVVVVELYVNGTARTTRWAGNCLRKFQTGRIQFYALLFSLGVTLLAYGMLLWNR